MQNCAKKNWNDDDAKMIQLIYPSIYELKIGVNCNLKCVFEWLYRLFKGLFRISPDVKHVTLMWIGDCLRANAGRGKLWTSEMGAIMSVNFVSDGFMVDFIHLLTFTH